MIHKAIALVATLLIDVLAFKPQKYKNILKTPKNQMEIKFAILPVSSELGRCNSPPSLLTSSRNSHTIATRECAIIMTHCRNVYHSLPRASQSLQVALGCSISLFCRLAVPLDGLIDVFGDTFSIFIARSQVVLS